MSASVLAEEGKRRRVAVRMEMAIEQSERADPEEARLELYKLLEVYPEAATPLWEALMGGRVHGDVYYRERPGPDGEAVACGCVYGTVVPFTNPGVEAEWRGEEAEELRGDTATVYGANELSVLENYAGPIRPKGDPEENVRGLTVASILVEWIEAWQCRGEGEGE